MSADDLDSAFFHHYATHTQKGFKIFFFHGDMGQGTHNSRFNSNFNSLCLQYFFSGHIVLKKVHK